MSIKTVLFDVGGVLISDSSFQKAFTTFVSESYELDDFYQSNKRYFFVYQLLKELETGALDDRQFWSKMTEKIEREPIQTVENFFSEIAPIEERSQSILDLVEKLQQANIFVGILSNTSKSYSQRLRTLGYYQAFEKIYLSCDIGFWKPDVQAYAYVAKDLNFQPEEILFIDDSKANIEAAEKFGMQTILFDSQKSTEIIQTILDLI